MDRATELKKKGQEVYQTQKARFETAVQKKTKASPDEPPEVPVEG
jgi:hypothetical protein